MCFAEGRVGCPGTAPAKHWLEDVPGVPVENKGKLDAVIPNLYDPAKKFSFEDCVFLTIQQSPLLVNSAVELEIKRLALTDAVWKYLPEPRMTVEVGNIPDLLQCGP